MMFGMNRLSCRRPDVEGLKSLPAQSRKGLLARGIRRHGDVSRGLFNCLANPSLADLEEFTVCLH